MEHLCTFFAVMGDGKSVGLIAQPRHQAILGTSRRERYRRFFGAQKDPFKTALRNASCHDLPNHFDFLFNATLGQAHNGQLDIRKFLCRIQCSLKLTPSTVDHQKVRCVAILPGPFKPASDNFTHAAKVVGRALYGFDRVVPVLVLCGFPANEANV